MGKVPALVDGDARLWDSGAICLYLADAYPQAGLGVPVGDPARAAFLQWTLYTNAVIEPAMGEKFGGRPVNTLQNGYGSFDLMIATLVGRPRHRPLDSRPRFTAPDVLLGSSVHFMELFKILPDKPDPARLRRALPRPPRLPARRRVRGGVRRREGGFTSLFQLELSPRRKVPGDKPSAVDPLANGRWSRPFAAREFFVHCRQRATLPGDDRCTSSATKRSRRSPE